MLIGLPNKKCKHWTRWNLTPRYGQPTHPRNSLQGSYLTSLTS